MRLFVLAIALAICGCDSRNETPESPTSPAPGREITRIKDVDNTWRNNTGMFGSDRPIPNPTLPFVCSGN